MKKILIITFFILSASIGTIAFEFESDSREIKKIIPPNEITISADTGKDYGIVTVKIETNKNNENLKIINIELFINNKWESVPKLEFSDLKKPLLNKTQIITETKDNNRNYLYIYFELDYKNYHGERMNKKVYIPFYDGKFETRKIISPPDCKDE